MENFSVDEINDANRRIAAYNMAQQQFEKDVLVLLWLKAVTKFCVSNIAQNFIIFHEIDNLFFVEHKISNKN